jgi:hypothetical protein
MHRSKWIRCQDHERRKESGSLQQGDEANRSTIVLYAARFGSTRRASDA